MTKTNKSYTKRIKVTSSGKLKVRAKGQNHMNAREDAKTRSAKKSGSEFTMSAKDRARFLPKK